MDAGTAAVLSGLITGVVALGASALGPTIGHVLSQRSARAERLRLLRLDQLDAAERGMVLQLDAAMAIADGEVGIAGHHLRALSELPYSNPLLVGDESAAKEWASACAGVLNHLPRHPVAGLQLALLGARIPAEAKAAVAHAKSTVLAAFDQQRERVTSDRRLEQLSPEGMAQSMSEMADVEAAMVRYDPTRNASESTGTSGAADE